MELKSELGILLFLLVRGRKTYEAYLSNGKTFLYAQILRENNEKIRDIVMSITFKLPERFHQQCIELVHHLDVWAVLWCDHKKILDPKLDDEFVFENKVNYPREIEKKLHLYFESL